jgi:predicted nucleotidyltransferase
MKDPIKEAVLNRVSELPVREVPVSLYQELDPEQVAALTWLYGARLRGDVHEASSLFDVSLDELVLEHRARGAVA